MVVVASTLEYLSFILEQARDLQGISYKKMMGEYLLYVDGVLIGGIYDDRLLIKKTKSNESFMLHDELPYEGAKPMWAVEDVDNKDSLITQLTNAYNDLKK